MNALMNAWKDVHDDAVAARPFIKSAGGKRKLALEIISILGPHLTPTSTYHEPFVGGGAVYFELSKLAFKYKARLSDANVPLIATYKVIRDNVEKLIRELSTGGYGNCDEDFYEIRKEFNNLAYRKTNDLAISARYIYLNKVAFNGLYRVNQSGEFNVPFGKYDNPTVCDAENLRACSKALQGVGLYTKDFGLTPVKKNDVVYCDPPYIPLNPTSNFTGYTAGGFGMEDQIRLRDKALEWRKLGAFVLLSNADTPVTRELYKGFDQLSEVSMARAINSSGEKRGKVGELLIW